MTPWVVKWIYLKAHSSLENVFIKTISAAIPQRESSRSVITSCQWQGEEATNSTPPIISRYLKKHTYGWVIATHETPNQHPIQDSKIHLHEWFKWKCTEDIFWCSVSSSILWTGRGCIQIWQSRFPRTYSTQCEPQHSSIFPICHTSTVLNATSIKVSIEFWETMSMWSRDSNSFCFHFESPDIFQETIAWFMPFTHYLTSRGFASYPWIAKQLVVGKCYLVYSVIVYLFGRSRIAFGKRMNLHRIWKYERKVRHDMKLYKKISGNPWTPKYHEIEEIRKMEKKDPSHRHLLY
jgi:hypothetical protein